MAYDLDARIAMEDGVMYALSGASTNCSLTEISRGTNHVLEVPVNPNGEVEIRRPGVVLIEHAGDNFEIIARKVAGYLLEFTNGKTTPLMNYLRKNSCGDLTDLGARVIGRTIALLAGMPVLYSVHGRWPDVNRPRDHDNVFRQEQVVKVRGKTPRSIIDPSSGGLWLVKDDRRILPYSVNFGEEERGSLLTGFYDGFHDTKERLIAWMKDHYDGVIRLDDPLLLLSIHTMVREYLPELTPGLPDGVRDYDISVLYDAAIREDRRLGEAVIEAMRGRSLDSSQKKGRKYSVVPNQPVGYYGKFREFSHHFGHQDDELVSFMVIETIFDLFMAQRSTSQYAKGGMRLASETGRHLGHILNGAMTRNTRRVDFNEMDAYFHG